MHFLCLTACEQHIQSYASLTRYIRRFHWLRKPLLSQLLPLDMTSHSNRGNSYSSHKDDRLLVDFRFPIIPDIDPQPVHLAESHYQNWVLQNTSKTLE